MQRIIRRTAKAERVALRRKEKRDGFKARGDAWEQNQTRLRQLRDVNQRMRDDRKNRKIDWETGALAPRRDTGELQSSYGSLHIYNFQPPDKNPEHQLQWSHIHAGDRVVMMRGRDKGKIGEVDEVHMDKAAVQVKDLNMVEVDTPDWFRQQNQVQDRNVTPYAQMVSIEDVRLVFPLPDPETGIPRDVIIDRLRRVDGGVKKSKAEPGSGLRAIPGTNTIIPWPTQDDPVYDDHESDTLRITVEETTFQPPLIGPPMPLSVIDELRNKYSKFRTRHDYDYRMKKELEDAKVDRRKGLIDTMRTPLQELAALRAQQKAATQKELTEEQLAKIGEVIAQEQERSMKSSGSASI